MPTRILGAGAGLIKCHPTIEWRVRQSSDPCGGGVVPDYEVGWNWRYGSCATRGLAVDAENCGGVSASLNTNAPPTRCRRGVAQWLGLGNRQPFHLGAGSIWAGVQVERGVESFDVHCFEPAAFTGFADQQRALASGAIRGDLVHAHRHVLAGAV